MREMIDVFFAKLSIAAIEVESNTGVVVVFLSVAMPWICIGVLLAIFFARSVRKKKNNQKAENYSTEGMALGSFRRWQPSVDTLGALLGGMQPQKTAQ